MEGIVSRIFYRDNGVRLIVNNKEIGLSDIHAIYSVERSKSTINRKDLGMNENSTNMNPAKDIKIDNDIYNREGR